MIFRNSKNEIRNINKLDFSNDRDYYAAIKKFMNVETKEVSDYDSEKQRLLKQMKQLI